MRLFMATASAGILLLAFAVWHVRSRPLAPPKIHVSTPSIDMGKITLTDDPLHFQFQIENWGKTRLKILGTKVSCGCTKPRAEKLEIEPDESTLVHLIVSPEAGGEKKVWTSLLTNDPENPEFQLFASWTGVTGLSVDPASIDFGEVSVGNTYTVPVRVSSLQPSIHAERVIVEPSCMTAEKSEDIVNVTLNPQDYPTHGTGVLKLYANSTNSRPVLVPLTWRLSTSHSAHPSSLFLGLANPGEERSASFVVRNPSGTAIAAEEWKWVTPLEFGSCEILNDAEGPRVNVKWRASGAAGPRRGMIQVSAEGVLLNLPVTAIVRASDQR